jgi:uncharacterized membrane protein YfcA
LWELLLPFVGFLVAIVAVMTGVGGGVFFVPLLTLAYGFVPANAVGTSLLVIIFSGISATIGYSRHKLVFFRTGLVLALATVPGSILGAYLTSVLSGQVLGLLFGVVLILVGVRMVLATNVLRKSIVKQEERKVVWVESELFKDRQRFLAAFGLSFFGGLASGLLGVGGGFLLVPIMSLILLLPIHVVVATSMFTMVFTSFAGVVQHWSLGNVDFVYGLLIAVGAVVGAQVASWICKRVSGKYLQLVFAVFLIVVSVQMIIKFL